jgi:hypothetical protein
MTWQFKAGAILVIVAGLFISGAVVGYRFRKPEVVVQTQIVEKVNTVVKTVVVKETAPDGTSTETTTIQTETVSTETSNTEPKPAPVPGSTSRVRPREYSVGLAWTPRGDKQAYIPTGVELGRLIYGPVWGTVGHDWRTHTTTVGIRYEF